MRTWIRDPLAIFAEGAERGIVVEGTRIVALVGRGESPERIDAVFDASRHVVLPGLVNAHHHFYQTLTRAHPQAINKPLFPWLVALYPIWSRLKPNHLRLAARLALAELLMSGCTTAADHHYLYPAGLENAVDIEVEEALRLGMRMTVSRGSMNLSAKDGGLPPDSVVQDEDAILADSERVLKLFHDPKPGAKIRVALAPCSPFSISKTPDERKRAPRRALRLPAPHASLRDRRRGAVLPQDVRPAAGRSPGGNRLDVEPGLARSRHPFQRRGDRAAGPSRRRNLPLRGLQHGARLRHLPDLRTRGRGRAARPRRRRLGLERFLEHDGGRAPRADDRAAALRRRQGHPSRRSALGDRRLGPLPRPHGHRPDRGGPRGRSRALHPRRAALFRRARPARRARALRRAPRRPGDGGGRLAASSTACRSGSTSPR